MNTLGLFWTQNEFFVDLVFTINLSFGSRGYCWLVFCHQFTQWVVFSFKKIYKILFKKKKNPSHMFWHENLSFWFKWLPSACFGPKMKFWFGFEKWHCPRILGNQKHQFLFQKVILNLFWPKHDCIDFILINIVILASFLN